MSLHLLSMFDNERVEINHVGLLLTKFNQVSKILSIMSVSLLL